MKRREEFDFCFVISDLLSTTPRAYREIVTVLNLGFSVCLVYNLRIKHAVAFHFDLIEQIKSERFYSIGIDWRKNTFRVVALKTVRKLLLFLFDKFHFTNPWLLMFALDYTSSWQILRANKIRAKVYVGHRQSTLPVITYLAKKHKAITWFDIEDNHFEESTSNRLNYFTNKFISNYKIDHYTNASELIGRAYLETLKTTQSSIEVLNSPLYKVDLINTYLTKEVSFFWYSQSVSFNRGLEIFFQSLKEIPFKCTVNLIGKVDGRFEEYVKTLQLETVEIIFHGFVSEEKIKEIAHSADVGLALELASIDKSRNLAITNKILTYAICGNYILATKTLGQINFMSRISQNGVLLEPTKESILYNLEKIFLNINEIRSNRLKRIENALKISWENQEEKLKEFIYQMIINKKIEEHTYHISTLATL